MFRRSIARFASRVARFTYTSVQILIYSTLIAPFRNAPPLVVNLPIVQARYACRFVAFRASRGTLEALPLIRVGVMVRRAIFGASAFVPKKTFGTGYALRAVGSAAGGTRAMARGACVIFGLVGARWARSYAFVLIEE